MLKLVISSTTLTNISASIAGFAASVAVVKESHKGLIAIQAEKDIKMAKLFDVTVEQYKLEKEFYQKDKSSFLDKLPLLKNIKAYANKAVSVTTENEEVTIQFSTEFIQEGVDLFFTNTKKVLVPIADLITIISQNNKDIKDFGDKWELNKLEEPQVEIVSKEVSAAEVPADIVAKVSDEEHVKDSVEVNGWVLSLSDSPLTPQPFFLDADKEDYKLIKDLTATRGDSTFECTPGTTALILGSENTIPELAERSKLPSSLIKALYEFYGIEFSPKQLGTEVKEATASPTPIETE